MAASSDVPGNLGEAEEEVLGRERRVLAEARRLSMSARQAAEKLEELRGRALEATAKHAGGEVARLLRDVEQTVLPILDLKQYFAAAQNARLHALQLRRKGLEASERAVAAYTSALQVLGHQLETQQHGLAAAIAREEAVVAESARRTAAELETQQGAAVAAEAARRRAEEAMRAPPPEIDVVPNAHRRGQARVRMQTVVDLASDSNFFTGFSTNLSEGGLFIATVSYPPPGTLIDVRFSLPSGEHVEVKGVVRWTREVNDKASDIFPGVGVQFVDLPPRIAAAVKRFVSQREPLFFPL